MATKKIKASKFTGRIIWGSDVGSITDASFFEKKLIFDWEYEGSRGSANLISQDLIDYNGLITYGSDGSQERILLRLYKNKKGCLLFGSWSEGGELYPVVIELKKVTGTGKEKKTKLGITAQNSLKLVSGVLKLYDNPSPGTSPSRSEKKQRNSRSDKRP